MTVFKNYLRIFKKHYYVVFVYLIAFGFFAVLSADSRSTEYKPTSFHIAVVDNAKNDLSKNLITYLDNFGDIETNLKDNRDLDMRVYYRYIDYAIVIPKDFTIDSVLKTISIDEAFTKTYIDLVINNYFNMTKQYKISGVSEDKILNLVISTSKEEAKVLILEKQNSVLANSRYFFNFLNYILIAMVISVIGTIMFSFKKKETIKRNMASPYGIKKINFELFLGNLLVGFFLWFVSVILFYVIYGNIMFHPKVLLMILNSFIFFLVVLSLALLISNLVKKKDSLGAIVNVLALGSSFLCGAFVPQELLDKNVVTISKILPSFWYIEANNNIHLDKSVLINFVVLIMYAIIFYVLNLYITKHKKNI